MGDVAHMSIIYLFVTHLNMYCMVGLLMRFRSLLFVPLKATDAHGKMHGARDSCIIACGALAEEYSGWEVGKSCMDY